jgi:hypothetical protein
MDNVICLVKQVADGQTAGWHPLDSGGTTISFGVDEPVLLDPVSALNRQSWEPLPVL